MKIDYQLQVTIILAFLINESQKVPINLHKSAIKSMSVILYCKLVENMLNFFREWHEDNSIGCPSHYN